MTRVLKLGGSVITDKTGVETLDTDALTHAISTISENHDDLVLVHGAGSFGHYHANKYNVTTTTGTTSAIEAWAIHDSMRKLNDHVLITCHNYTVPAVPVHPFSIGARSPTGALTLPMTAIRGMLNEDFVPVAHGDVLTHQDRGVTIISGDELVCHFATELDATRVGFCTNVRGVLDSDGALIDRITSYEDVESLVSASDDTDVTGGMAAKVKTLLDRELSASIFSPDDLTEFLAGGTPGTSVVSST